jgi:SAM-dependent methyltransferase
MIGVPVADEHRVDPVRGRSFEQPRHGRVPGVDEQPEAVVLDQVATARLTRVGPGAAAAENREPHQATVSPNRDRVGCGKGTTLSGQTHAEDPFDGRHPTSHERMTGLPWDASYHDGPAPWDIGQPQRAVVRLASEGGFTGAVLDAGCGSGENALHIASLGLPVLGVDVAETALAMARQKAVDRGIDADFAVADALWLERLGRTFQTVLDCGLFHTFDGAERPGYVTSLASVTEHDATLYVLCFRDDGPDTGPHPVSQDELRAAFNSDSGWNIAAIEPDRVETRFHADGAPAWLVTVKRI